jgi:uncharacterized lipoprotein YmbA
MKSPSSRFVWLAAVSLLLAPCSLFLTSCNLAQPQADSVRYFTLSSPAGAPPVAEGTRVRPVQLAGQLHGRAMTVRIADQEVIYLEEVRWAEPLDEAITQLLRTRLGAVPGDATVTVQVQRCELVRSNGNRVELAATYAIVPAGGDKSSALHGAFTATPRVWDGKDYGALVGLIRDAVGELGDAIAAALPEKK